MLESWNEAKTQTPFDTTKSGQNGHLRTYVGGRSSSVISGFGLYYTIPHMVGLPYSVNFKKDRNRTTLVWHGVRSGNRNTYGWWVSEEYYEATKSEAHNEKFNYLFGFLMAYFKRVHKEMSKTQRKKYLNMVLYPMTQIQQIAFLKGVFYENCRLDYKEATSYLEKIAKGVEFEDGKEKTK